MIENPPDFKISKLCCNGAKKRTSHKYDKNSQIDLECIGMRRAEGGIRATAVKSCFRNGNEHRVDSYYPIFWFTDKNKEEYCEKYGITHSRCYTEYGMKRSGCCGCCFNSKFEEDLEVVKEHEPWLYKAVNNIFGKSYDYTRKYREYKKTHTKKVGVLKNQISMF